MCLRIDHKRHPFLRTIFRYRLQTHACVCVFERSCARVYLPISRERNETFLVKVFIRFLVKVSNFSAASVILMYIYALFIIMYLAQFMYISVMPQSLGSEKKKEGEGPAQLPFLFLTNSRIPRRQTVVTVAKIDRRYAKLTAKFRYVVIRAITYFSKRNDVFQYSENLQWVNFLHSSRPNERTRMLVI